MIRDFKKFVGLKADEEIEIQKYKQMLKNMSVPSPDVHMKIGRLQEKLRQKDAAIAEYETAVRWYTEAEETVGVLVASKLIARLNPNHHDALANIAFIELQQGIKLTDKEFAEFLQNLGQPLQRSQKKGAGSGEVAENSAPPAKSRLALSRKRARAKKDASDPNFQARRQSLVDLIEGNLDVEEQTNTSFDFARQSPANTIEQEITEKGISRDLKGEDEQEISELADSPDMSFLDLTQHRMPGDVIEHDVTPGLPLEDVSRHDAPPHTEEQSLNAPAQNERSESTHHDDRSLSLREMVPRLQECPFLAKLSRAELDLLIEKSFLQTWTADSPIIQQAAHQRSLCLVLAGEVDVRIGCQEFPDSASTMSLYADNFWGEHSFLGQTDILCSAVAVTESLILQIPFSVLAPLAKKYPSLLGMLKKECKRRCFYPFLERIALFKDVTASEKHCIAEYLFTEHAVKGQKIIEEGEVDESLYFIKSGRVEVHTTLVERGELQVLQVEQEYIPLATLEAGDFFGEGAFFTHEPRSATISALTDVELLKLPTRHIKAVIQHYPQVEDILRQYHEQRVASTMRILQKCL
ncbi:hypothetical protein CSA56_17550 [candidate division KSB3 bacterium]|uniref:Cyclic nucleotide-binding domain-containing protein n=1 Tax=candidate division KSB3 bacterium TaxID=2044937 RepID=A0A2G6K7S1_9BACT|nr:MAG: hypothetical protein CSA56_17550 [candidate division KSB3 bacterium]